MKKFTFLHFLILFICCFFYNPTTFAQEQTSYLNSKPNGVPTKVTNLIFSVDPKNNGINGVFLKGPDKEAQIYLLKGKCYRCEFYGGTIEGSFKVYDSNITPGKKAILTINTMENLMEAKKFDPGNFPPGSRFNLARIKTTVIANQPGSFKVRIN